MSPEIRLSVHQVLHFFRPAGACDIPVQAPVLSADGQRCHRREQASWPAGVETEKTLSIDLPLHQGFARITGKADGFTASLARPVFLEIKTERNPDAPLDERRLLRYQDQLRLYASLWLRQQAADGQTLPESIGFALHRVPLSARKSTRIEAWEESTTEISTHCERIFSRVSSWLSERQKHRRARQPFLKELAFPFADFRPGQRALAAAAYRFTGAGEDALLEAPTGSGKSLAMIFPLLRRMGEGQIRQIMQLSARNEGQLSALEAVACLTKGAGVFFPLRVLQLQGRDKLCLESMCLGDACPRRANFYEHLPAASQAASEKAFLDTAALKALAIEHGICPHALQAWLAPWWDILIGDYNYAFAPGSRLDFTITDNQPVLLMDEAHNLPARAREMFSAQLDTRQLGRLRRVLLKGGRARRSLGSLLRHLDQLSLQSAIDQKALQTLSQKVAQTLADCFEEPTDELSPEDHPIRNEALSALQQWQSAFELSPDSYRVHWPNTERLVLDCLSAAQALNTLSRPCHNRIAYSACLTPPDFYGLEMGLSEDCQRFRQPSPFRPEQALILQSRDISLRWQDRPRSLPAVVDYIAALWQTRPGNYWVFSPSHDYQNLLLDAFRERHADIPSHYQIPDMPPEQRQAFLQQFRNDPQHGLGFVVLGSLFNESVDLPGDALLGVAVLGTGRPPPSERLDRIAAWYNERGYDGERFAYTLPGWQKVVQAVGRVIRRDDDRGVVLLLDQRLQNAPFRTLRPPHWQVQACQNPMQAREVLTQFWADESPQGEQLTHN